MHIIIVRHHFLLTMQISIDTPKRRRTASEKLRKDISGKNTEGERRSYIDLPIKHEFHIMGEVRICFFQESNGIQVLRDLNIALILISGWWNSATG